MSKKPTNIKVGMNVKLCRIKLKLTQEELAHRAGLSRSMLSNIERGIQSPTVETLAAIAGVLHIDLYKLFIFED